ncbi:MAG: hypothetical protein ABI606_19085 [Rhodoferax sp.]
MANNKTATAATQGLALHIGLNSVSDAAYSGWSGPLAACEFDANNMAAGKVDSFLTQTPFTV